MEPKTVNLPEKQKEREIISEIYFSPNDPKACPLKVADSIREAYKKAKKDPRWLNVWVEQNISEDEWGRDASRGNIHLLIKGERWQTDEEYIFACEASLARTKMDFELYKKMSSVLDQWTKEIDKMETKIKNLKSSEEKRKKADKKAQRTEKIAALLKEQEDDE